MFFLMSENLSSVYGMKRIVWEKLEKEVKEGRVLGFFEWHTLPTLRLSHLGIVPKKVLSGALVLSAVHIL